MMSRNEVSLICRYGGNLVEESGKVSYKDGTNSMILLGAQEINYPRLLSEVLEVCKWTNVGTIKYKHPELGLDCLVSVKNDKDLRNMMKVFETQNNGPIQLFVSEAQQALPIHNTIPSNNEEIAVLTEETRGGRKEMPLQNNSNMDVNAETAGMPTDLQVGVDQFGLHSPNLSASNPTEYGYANNTAMILEEGQEFPNADDFDKFLKEYVIRPNFEYKRYKSGHGRFAAKCIKKDCSLGIQASQISASQPTLKIKSLKGKHTCNLDKQFKVSHYQATRKWIADIVEHRNYFQSTPKDIADAIEKEYGIRVGYHKAWRGRQLAQKRKNCLGKSRQHRERNYYNIEELCEDIRRTNPGSRVNLQGKSIDDNHLKLFVSYEDAVVPVFQMACKPVVELAAVKIGGKQPFIWFMAVGADTDCRGLLLACGFMEFDREEDMQDGYKWYMQDGYKCYMQDGYKWFCSELFNILGERISNLVFVVEYRDQGGAMEVVRAIFPHSQCRYSERSFIHGILNKFDKLASVFLWDAMYDAVGTSKQFEFEECMSEMHENYTEVWGFLININPEYWATSHFKGAYRDETVLDLIADLFTDCDFETEAYRDDTVFDLTALWFADRDRESDVSVTVLVEHLHYFMMEGFTERVEISSGWTTVLLPRFETHSPRPFPEIQILESTATTTPTRFRVTDVGDFFFEFVDIHMRNCSCGAWQKFGRPCWHAEEVIKKFQLNRYEYWDECYMADQYRKAYSKAVIHPLPRRLEKKEWLAGILNDILNSE